jgi:hypothetical protein
MLAQQLYFIRTALMVFAILFIPLTDSANARQAPDPSLVSMPQPAQAEPIPLGTLLDSEGKPIINPSEPQSGFEYSAPTTSAEPKTKTPKSTTATKANKSKKLNRKQQLASRERVANDPNCRWLDQRMSQLEAQMRSKQGNTAKYRSDELSARQQEWQCLKGGAEGPNQDDHSRCQYRR